MKTSKDVYEELRKKYTDQEIAEGFIFNETLPASEQRDVDEEFRKLRLERLKNMSPQEILVSNLLQFKYLMKMYLEREKYDEQYSFSNQLKRYIKITGRSSKKLAGDLDIHPTKLSRVVNAKENPNIELMYRLEEHSSGEIPAHYWWRIYSRELENNIKTDLQKKLHEAGKVKNPLEIRA